MGEREWLTLCEPLDPLLPRSAGKTYRYTESMFLSHLREAFKVLENDFSERDSGKGYLTLEEFVSPTEHKSPPPSLCAGAVPLTLTPWLWLQHPGTWLGIPYGGRWSRTVAASVWRGPWRWRATAQTSRSLGKPCAPHPVAP